MLSNKMDLSNSINEIPIVWKSSKQSGFFGSNFDFGQNLLNVSFNQALHTNLILIEL